MEVGDAVAFEHTGALQLDLARVHVVEEAAPLPEEDGDHVQLELVEEAGGERELRDGGAVDEHAAVAAASLAPGKAASRSPV